MNKEQYAVYRQTPHFQQLRLAKLKQCGYQCERCGIKNVPLDVHHTEEAYRMLYNERLEDLRAYCRRCHEQVHGISWDDKVNEYLAG